MPSVQEMREGAVDALAHAIEVGDDDYIPAVEDALDAITAYILELIDRKTQTGRDRRRPGDGWDYPESTPFGAS